MSSLFGTLSIALRALMAHQGALDVTSNNIANINTPGYSRQRAVFQPDPPVSFGSLQLGTGVSLEKVESIRDRVLELRIHQETQQEGRLDSFLTGMRQVEALFNEAQGVGLEGVLTEFFNSLQELTVEPSSILLRQKVLSSAENLTQAFRQKATNLATLQTSFNQTIIQSVTDVNRITEEIANLNVEVSGLVGIGKDPGAFADQRNHLIRQLSELIDIAVIDAGQGSVTITTSNGTALVVGTKNVPLSVQLDPATGLHGIRSQGADITGSITAGRIGGLLDIRDQQIPAVLADLDALAVALANNLNTGNAAGFDLLGNPGGDFFVPPPAGGVGAARVFAVAITDPALIAASSDGAPGSNGNLLNLVDLRNQSIVNGQRPDEFYSNMISRLGNDIAGASFELEAESLVLRQLRNQRSNISGVSLDEEAANLIRFQRAFEASARVISVVDELTELTINLGRR